MLCELEEYVQSHVNWVHTVPCLQFWWTHLIQEINPASVNSQLPIWSPTGHGDRLWSLMNKLPTSHRLVGGTTKSIGAPCESQSRTTWVVGAWEWKIFKFICSATPLNLHHLCSFKRTVRPIPCWIHSTWYQPQSQWGHVLLSTENASLIPVL